MWPGHDHRVGLQPIRGFLCVSILFSAPSICLGQDDTLKLEDEEARSTVNPGGRSRRPGGVHFDYVAPIRWDFFSTPPPEASPSSAGALDTLFGAPDALLGGAMHALSSLSHDAGSFDMLE